MHNALSNARHPGEKFQDYKARLKLVGRKLKQYLRGSMVHVSTEIVSIERDKVDAEATRAIVSGAWRDMQDVTLPNGTVVRVGRTKGDTFHNKRRDEREDRSYWRALRTERKARWAAVSPARA